MKSTARVTELLENGYAVVEAVRHSACADCHAARNGECDHCELFFGNSDIKCKAVNSVGAKLGDNVIISARSRNVILNSFLIFIIPLISGGFGYALGQALGKSDKISAIFFLLLLAVGYASVYLFTRFSHGKTDTVYITEIINNDEK